MTPQQRKAIADLRRAAQQCVICGGLPVPDKEICCACQSKVVANATREARRQRRSKVGPAKARNDLLAAKGCCIVCTLPNADKSRRICETCREAIKDKNTKLRESRSRDGLCSYCGDHVLRVMTKVCERCAAAFRAKWQQRKVEVLNAYGGCVCVGCGETDLVTLQIDHINGGGRKHAQEIGGQGKLYGHLKRSGWPSGFRVLCANCNFGRAPNHAVPRPLPVDERLRTFGPDEYAI